MPVSQYFNGPKGSKGEAVLAAMRKRYGQSAGTRVFYATVNKDRKGTPAQRAIQPKAAPGSALRKRRRQLASPPSATGNTITGASTSTTRIGY